MSIQFDNGPAIFALRQAVDALMAEVRAMRAELNERLERAATTAPPTPVPAMPGAGRPRPPKLILSFREAARMLGIRNESVGDLVADKKIKPVMKNGKPKIPLSEVERLMREGFDLRRS